MQPSLSEDKDVELQHLVGVWSLVPGGYYTLNPDGTRTFPLSPEAQGRLIVTPLGFWTPSFQNPHRALCVNSSQGSCTAAEVYPHLWMNYINYQGKASVLPDKQMIDRDGSPIRTGRVVIDIDFALTPNQVGTQIFRDYILDDDTLTISLDSTVVPGAKAIVVLRRTSRL